MAKIKTTQKGGSVTVTRDGATKRTHNVTDEGVLTCRKDEVAQLLRDLPGATLVEGTAEEAEPDAGQVDETADVTDPPQLPAKPGR